MLAMARAGAIFASAFGVAGCLGGNGETPRHHLTIHIEGEGRGWVHMAPNLAPDARGAIVCTETCTLEMPPAVNPVDRLFIRAGTTQRIASSTCPLVESKECEILPRNEDREVTVTFEKDPYEVSTLFLDDAPRSLAFTGNDELVVGGATTLRRIAVDGTPRWQIARPDTTLVAVSASGLIVVGTKVAAYHGDGTLAWSSDLVASDLAIAPDGSPILATASGRVVALSAADGSIRWESAPVEAKRVAVDRTGRIVAYGGTAPGPHRMRWFDADGTPLTEWPLSALGPVSAGLVQLDFDANDLLVAATGRQSGTTPDPSFAIVRFDGTGQMTVLQQYLGSPIEQYGFELTADRLFRWRQATIYAGARLLDLAAFDATGVKTWSASKGYGYGYKQSTPGDTITPSAAACIGARRCAVAGEYDGPPETGMRNWIEVVNLE